MSQLILIKHADTAGKVPAAADLADNELAIDTLGDPPKMYVGTPSGVKKLSGGIYIGPSPPTNVVEGELWWRNTTGELFVWYADGGTVSQWVSVGVGEAGPPGPRGPEGIEGKPGTVVVDTAPPNPDDNTVWWNSSEGTLYLWFDDGVTKQWVGLASPAGPRGPQGLRGLQGVEGPRGLQGARGDTGLVGPQGERGLQGDRGLPGTPLAGVTDGSAAAPGEVGQHLFALGTAVAMPNGAWANVASLALPAGNWLVWGQNQFTGGVFSRSVVSLSFTSGNEDDPGTRTDIHGSASSSLLQSGMRVVRQASARTVYILGFVNMTTAGTNATGRINALRFM